MSEIETTATPVKEHRGRKRHAWLAVLLSLLLPGLGQVYCGRIVHGITILFIITWFPFAWTVATVKAQRATVPFTLFFFGMVLLATVVAAVDSYRQARRTRPDYPLKDYNCGGVYAMLLLMALGGSLGFGYHVKDRIVEVFCMPVGSMVPTIQPGDRILVNKLAYMTTQPERGDVVIFPDPENRRSTRLRRIVALAGDTVEVQGPQLLINGCRLERDRLEPLEVTEDGKRWTGSAFRETNGKAQYSVFVADAVDGRPVDWPSFGPITVPPYCCLVMSDNRNLSQDGRQFVPVPIVAIQGKSTYLYWPADDWSRFGRLE